MKTYEFGNADSDIVLIQPVDDHDLKGIENEFMTISLKEEIEGQEKESSNLLEFRYIYEIDDV